MSRAPVRIAIVKLAALGDVLRTTCLLVPLRRKYPACEIWWFTLEAAAPLLERNPYITRLLRVGRYSAQDLPSEPFEWVMGLDEDTQACELSSRLPAVHRFGAFADKGKLFCTDNSRPWFEMGLLNRDSDGSLRTANRLKQANRKAYPQLLFEMLDLPTDYPSDARPLLYPDPSEETWARSFATSKGIRPGDLVIGLNTSAGGRWPTKQLSLPGTLRLLTALKELPSAKLLLLGGPEEVERNAKLLRESPVPLIDTGTTNSMARFISLVNLCGAVITSDSLGLHIATALEKYVIAFFGPTSAVEIELRGEGVKWMPAQPCECYYLPKCHAKTFCLDTLDTNQVIGLLSNWSLASR